MCRSTRHGEFSRRRKSDFVELSINSIIVCGSPMLSCQQIGCVWITESFLLVSWLLPPHQRSSLVSSAQDKRAPEVSDLLCLLLHDSTGRPCPCSLAHLSLLLACPREQESAVAHPAPLHICARARARNHAASRMGRVEHGPCRSRADRRNGPRREHSRTGRDMPLVQPEPTPHPSRTLSGMLCRAGG